MPARRPGSRAGQTLKGKWHLDAQIGSGGMATVYKASHRNGMRAAVKVLHDHVAATPGVRERFLREGYLANRVEHPGSVRVLDEDEDDGTVFLVMELLEGETWKDRWASAGHKLPVDAVLDVAQATLDVLVAAHEKGIVHRDIKPDNVFLTSDGKIKILDFGIARLREGTGNTHATETGATLGTPAFMPPEQARAHWDEIDARCDLFALGATMWTMLTGRLVHDAKTVQDLLIAAATEQAAPISSVVPALPAEIAAVIDRSLRFDRKERWPDAAAMRAALALARLPPKKERAKTLQMTTDAREPVKPTPPTRESDRVPIEAAARTPETTSALSTFATDSVTTRLLAEPLPDDLVPRAPVTTRLAVEPVVEVSTAESTAALAPAIALPEPVFEAPPLSSMLTTQHVVAADRRTADLARPVRVAVGAAAAVALGCALWLGWRSVAASSRHAGAEVAASAEVVATAPAPPAPAPTPSAAPAHEPVVEPAEVAHPPDSASAPASSASAPRASAPPPPPSAEPSHPAAAATTRHPASHPPRPTATAPTSKRDPASVFATH